MFQITLTPAAGKRLIANATIELSTVKKAILNGTIVIIAGTTNGYIAEKLLTKSGQSSDFNRNHFFRGITVPPDIARTDTGRLPDESQFPGDIVLKNGIWKKGLTIFDVADTLKKGDVIIKGANCINLLHKKAGILIGHPKGGTIYAALQAIIGKRTTLIIPAGLEKRITDDIDTTARLLNNREAEGPRLMPVTGELITEIEAIEILFGLSARLVAGGGVCGAEGAIWLAIEGEREKEVIAKQTLMDIAQECAFSL